MRAVLFFLPDDFRTSGLVWLSLYSLKRKPICAFDSLDNFDKAVIETAGIEGHCETSSHPYLISVKTFPCSMRIGRGYFLTIDSRAVTQVCWTRGLNNLLRKLWAFKEFKIGSSSSEISFYSCFKCSYVLQSCIEMLVCRLHSCIGLQFQVVEGLRGG